MESYEMSATDRRQGRFILGAIVGGVIAYYVTGNNLFWAAIGAIVAGYVLSKIWG